MSKINGVGISDYTKTKQSVFESLLKQQLAVCRAIAGKWKTRLQYNFFDLTAGPGDVCGYCEQSENCDKKEKCFRGSPLIFIDVMTGGSETSKFNATFFEKNKISAEILSNRLDNIVFDGHANGIHNININIVNKRFEDGFREPENNAFGLLYLDTSGSVPNFDALAEISKHMSMQRVDFLLHIATTSIKRVRRSAIGGGDDLNEGIRKINKKYWYTTPPQTKHQWIFLLGTNYPSYTNKKNGLYRLDTEIGKENFNIANYIPKEREKLSGQMYFFQDLYRREI